MSKFDLGQLKTELVQLFINNEFGAMQQKCNELNNKEVKITLIDEFDNEVVTGTLTKVKLRALFNGKTYDKSKIVFSVRYVTSEGRKGSDILDHTVVKEMLIQDGEKVVI